METLLTLILLGIVVVGIAKSQEFFVYFSVVESLWTVRFYSTINGIPVMLLIPLCFLVFWHRKFSLFRSTGPLVVSAFMSVYAFCSYYGYFHVFNYSIFNNMMWLLLVCCMKWEKPERLISNCCRYGFSVGVFMSILCLCTVFLGDGRLIGNLRQAAFYIIFSMNMGFACLYWEPSTRTNRKIMLGLGLMGFAVVASGGRLPFACMLLILALWFVVFNKLTAKTLLMFFSFVVLVLFLLSSGWFNDYLMRGKSLESNADSLYESGAFTSGRSSIYRYALEQFYDHPVFGLGYLSFKDVNNVYNPFLAIGSHERLSVHSTWLQYMAELGIVGTCLYALLLFSLIYVGIKYCKMNVDRSCYAVGCLLLICSCQFFLGGTLDNHGFHYRFLFVLIFIAGLAEKRWRGA